jgi:hypothetical protein
VEGERHVWPWYDRANYHWGRPKETERNAKDAEKDPPALENKLAAKVVEQIPGVKKAMDVKKKVDKVKKIIE